MANEDQEQNEKSGVELETDPESMISGYSDETEVSSEKPVAPKLPEIDRQRLGELLRRGQRYAAHVKTKVAIPELAGWAQDCQHFMNEHGL